MGASLSWFAVRGKSPEAVLQEFGLRNVGKEYHDTPFSGGVLPSGWFLIIRGRHEFTNDEVRRLSRGCEVVACFVEEHVMVSRAAAWKGGEQIWAVTHDAQESDDHLDVEGEPPPGFISIRDRLTMQQGENDGVDFIFNIPVGLAKQITGYSHEDLPEVDFDNFVKPTFLQRVLGR
ncbi:MAG: hypothetical protein ACK4UN_19945 [Limisphaerales bacterium]